MTFTIIDNITNTRETIDLEDLGDLQILAERFGWAPMVVDMWHMTITIG